MASPTSTIAEPCQERLRLTHLYSAAAAEFSRTVAVLGKRLGVISKPEYDALRQFAEQAHIRLQQARLDLESHVVQHGC